MTRTINGGRIATVAIFYAAAVILFAFVAGAHHGPSNHVSRGASLQASGSLTLCAGSVQKGENNDADVCCDACVLISAAGPPPTAAGFSRFEHERKARIYFAQRFGHVSDTSPEDLRSRAPPLRG